MDIARPEFKTQERRHQLFILAAVILAVGWSFTPKAGFFDRLNAVDAARDLRCRQLSRRATIGFTLAAGRRNVAGQ